MQSVHTSVPARDPISPAEPRNNKLLASLSFDDYQRVAAHLRPVEVRARQALHKQGEPISEVYFPGGGVWALTKTMEDGQTAQVATVGNEGVIGTSVYFGDRVADSDTLVQLPDGGAMAMPIGVFIDEMNRHGAFFNKVIRYSQALISQIMQTTVCNGLHSAEQRCCRWLLMTRDRAHVDEFPVTHEFVSTMLGVRRPTVTIIMRELQHRGLIESRRGSIRIVDTGGLVVASCECYRTANTSFRRLMPEIVTSH